MCWHIRKCAHAGHGENGYYGKACLRVRRKAAHDRVSSWRAGQATVEAAFAIPVLFTLLLLLMQPGIILYDRMVMNHAAAEACRLLATRSGQAGLSDSYCTALVKRHLAAIPPHDLFHVHSSGCSWDIQLEGDEGSGSVRVCITNKLRLLPLFDVAGSLVGIADGDGCIRIQVEQHSSVQPAWVWRGSLGNDPAQWVGARKEEE